MSEHQQKYAKVCTFYRVKAIVEILFKKSRIRETKNLSTDADSRTNTNLKWLRDLSKKKLKNKKKYKKI